MELLSYAHLRTGYLAEYGRTNVNTIVQESAAELVHLTSSAASVLEEPYSKE